jgi:hypothetical protein
VKKWLRWLFRRGERSTLLLNMAPGDEVIAMTPWQGYLVIATRGGGELWLVSTN